MQRCHTLSTLANRSRPAMTHCSHRCLASSLAVHRAMVHVVDGTRTNLWVAPGSRSECVTQLSEAALANEIAESGSIRLSLDLLCVHVDGKDLPIYIDIFTDESSG